MVGYRPARGLYTLLTDPDLVGHNLLGNLCKAHVASLCNHASVVWYGALQTPHGWYELTLFSNYVANKIWLTKVLNCLNLSHPLYGLACYVVFPCWVRHVLTLVYFLVSTILGLLLRLGELWRLPRWFPGVLGVCVFNQLPVEAFYPQWELVIYVSFKTMIM
jgi:hypothetical protein